MPRARGREIHLRPLRRCGDADLRRAGRLADPADPGAPRAGRNPHGRRLRTLDWAARRGARDLRPGRDQHRDGPAHGADGLVARDRDLRPADPAGARQGCLSGSGCHRHHLPRREALLPREERERDPPHRAGGLPRGDHRSTRPRADRLAEGHRPGPLPGPIHRRGRPPRLSGRRARRSPAHRRGRALSARGAPPPCSTWAMGP